MYRFAKLTRSISIALLTLAPGCNKSAPDGSSAPSGRGARMASRAVSAAEESHQRPAYLEAPSADEDELAYAEAPAAAPADPGDAAASSPSPQPASDPISVDAPDFLGI
jgi:hypothetical protein